MAAGFYFQNYYLSPMHMRKSSFMYSLSVCETYRISSNSKWAMKLLVEVANMKQFPMNRRFRFFENFVHVIIINGIRYSSWKEKEFVRKFFRMNGNSKISQLAEIQFFLVGSIQNIRPLLYWSFLSVRGFIDVQHCIVPSSYDLYSSST